jgi:mRNA-degrading endonuclease RelE of RelBE toxin-antitoxin system
MPPLIVWRKALFIITNIKPLSGDLQGSYHLRIGNIQIIFSVDDTVKTVYIEVIGFRGDVYKK